MCWSLFGHFFVAFGSGFIIFPSAFYVLVVLLSLFGHFGTFISHFLVVFRFPLVFSRFTKCLLWAWGPAIFL